MAHPVTVDPATAWLCRDRIGGSELPPELRSKPRQRARFEFSSVLVEPGDHAVLDAFPQGYFLADTFHIASDVAKAFELEAIKVGNRTQTEPGQTLPASALHQLRLLDWCPPGFPVRLRVANVSSSPVAFRCVVEGDLVDVVDDEAPKRIEVPLQCLYLGCKNEGHLQILPSSSGYNLWPESGWVFYALGFPSERRNLGVCRDHQHVVLPASGAGPALDVVVLQETHGVYYEIREAGSLLGKATFPTNTLQLQFAPRREGVTDRLLHAGRRVAAAFGFLPDAAAE